MPDAEPPIPVSQHGPDAADVPAAAPRPGAHADASADAHARAHAHDGEGHLAGCVPCPRDHLPRHIAIIMDGNGRWAAARQRPRLVGHRAGSLSVRTCVESCAELGIEALTLFSFSSENWKRPPEEVRGLMDLLVDFLATERAELVERGIRFRHIGRRDRLSSRVLAAIKETEAATSDGDGLTLSIALDYGSRDEIVEAARSLARDAAAGTLDPETIDEAAFSDRLQTAGLPDPDLLIRTAGEQRLSNYLLWQISYAELHVCEKCWPDFGRDELHAAIRDFAGRSRRFGSLVDQVGSAR